MNGNNIVPSTNGLCALVLRLPLGAAVVYLVTAERVRVRAHLEWRFAWRRVGTLNDAGELVRDRVDDAHILRPGDRVPFGSLDTLTSPPPSAARRPL